MSISYFGEDKDTQRNAKVDKQGVVTSSRGHIFVTDAPCSEFDVGVHANCPRVGMTHPDNPVMWCVGVSVTNHAPWAGWKAVAEYSSEREYREDPTQEPARISWGTEQYQEVAVVDTDDNLILNSAGDFFDPPVMKDFSRRIAHVSKNVTTVPIWFQDYEDAVNSDAFTVGGMTVPVGKAKCQRTTISEVQTKNDITYYTVTMDIHLSKKGWARKILDAGFRRSYPNPAASFNATLPTTLREFIKTKNRGGEMEYPSTPVPLDGAGSQIDEPTPQNAVYLEFVVYDSLPFAVLPLY